MSLPTISMRPRRLRRLLWLIALGGLVAAATLAIVLPKASAMPDPYMPIPGYWCQGGGGQFGGFGGFCDGAAYPDGTHWHVANGMGIWLPAVCTFADGGTTPAPGGCRG